MKKMFTVIVLLVLVIFIAIYFRQAENNTNIEPTPQNTIGESSTTTASFFGFYSIKRYGIDGQMTCPALLVSKSEDSLFVYFTRLVQEGNTVNSLDKEGNLLLNLDLDNVATDTKAKIVSSTRENPIKVNVQKLSFGGKGAEPCTSFVNILSVE